MTHRQFQDHLVKLILKAQDSRLAGAAVLSDLLALAGAVYHAAQPSETELRAHGIGYMELPVSSGLHPPAPETLQ